MPNVSTDVSFGPASRCAVLMSSCVSFDGVLISPNCETNPRQKVPEISPIFTADNAKLHVSREKDGKLRLVYAGWNDAKIVQPDGCGQARRRGWKVNPTSAGSDETSLKTLGPPSGPPWFFTTIGAAHAHRTVHFSPSFLIPRYA